MIDYTKHLSKFEDLMTTYAETRAGFISIALEKNKRATPYVEEARILNSKISNVAEPNQLITLLDIRNGLIAASGISEKAANHLGEAGCNEAIAEFIRNFLIPAGEKFKEELVFRFLLTRGDSLGGSMRNIVGAIAQKKLCISIVSSLRLAGRNFHWLDGSAKKWINSESNSKDLEIENAKGLFWVNSQKQPRLLLFNLGVPIVRNNIDIILFDSDLNTDLKILITDPAKYMQLLKIKWPLKYMLFLTLDILITQET